MENKNAHSIVLLILVIIGLGALGFIGTSIYKDVKEVNTYKQYFLNMSKTSVERINDSTYTIYLGDSTSYFTMQKSGDKLNVDAHELAIFHSDGDTISVITHKTLKGKKYKDEFLYKFKYNDFYDGEMPYRDNIKVKFK